MKKVLPFIIVPILIMLGVILYVSSQVKNKPAQDAHNYSINIEKPAPQKITLNEPTSIRFTIEGDKGEVIKKFLVGHEKLMHVILVRKDLMQYQHLHPTFNEATGEFTVPVTFTVEGPYRLFADFIPADENPEKRSVTLKDDFAVGDVSNFQPHPVTADEKLEKAVPPDYTVMYNFPEEFTSEKELLFSLQVTKNSQDIQLEPYLGALGHTVILKEGTLDYIHTHAGEKESQKHGAHNEHDDTIEKDSNKIDFMATFPESGTYRIFTEFQHEGEVFISEYTVKVK